MRISRMNPRRQGGLTRLRGELDRAVKSLHASLQDDDDANEENSLTSESEGTLHSLQMSLLHDVHYSNRTLSPHHHQMREQLLNTMLRSSHALHQRRKGRRKHGDGFVDNGFGDYREGDGSPVGLRDMKSPAARQREGAERLSKAGLQRRPEEKRTSWCGRALPFQPRRSSDRLIPEQGALGVRVSPVKGPVTRFNEGPRDALRVDTERAHRRGLRSLDFKTAHRSHRKFDESTKRATVLGAPCNPETVGPSRFVNSFNRFKAGEADYATAVPGFDPAILTRPHELAILTDGGGGGGGKTTVPGGRSGSGGDGDDRAVWYRSG